MNEKPKELSELVDNVACLNAGIALLQVIVDAGEHHAPEDVLITLDMAIELLSQGRDGLLRAGVKALPVQATKDYFGSR